MLLEPSHCGVPSFSSLFWALEFLVVGLATYFFNGLALEVCVKVQPFSRIADCGCAWVSIGIGVYHGNAQLCFSPYPPLMSCWCGWSDGYFASCCCFLSQLEELFVLLIQSIVVWDCVVCGPLIAWYE